MTSDSGLMPILGSRDAYVDYLEDSSERAADELQAQRTRRTLLKTYMLETVGHGTEQPSVATIFGSEVGLDRLDETLFRVRDQSHPDGVVGLLEQLDDRHPVLYTMLPSNESDRWVHQHIDQNAWLDRLWLSAPFLTSLWDETMKVADPRRFVRLVFEHDAVYESDSPAVSEENTPWPDDDEGIVDGHRHSRIEFGERVGVLANRLPQLARLYDPLHSLVQLQVPAAGRGGHVLNFDGKATNRSGSFLDHRVTVEQIVRLYRAVTERLEDELWTSAEPLTNGQGSRFRGSPVVCRYSSQLPTEDFANLVDRAFLAKRSRFRIDGLVERRNATRVQIAAIDRHLWQPFLLEASTEQLLAVLPQGMCANSVHRLITNVQRLVDPRVSAWVGSVPYSTAIAETMETLR